MEQISNLDGPVEIGPGTYWVGTAAREFLKRNIYLRVFNGNGKKINLVIDPGPPSDFEILSNKAARIIGSLAEVDFAYANHQDPDVIASAPQLLKLNTNLVFLMSEDTWRLVQYYGIPKANFRAVERFTDMKTALVTGQTIQFVPTPFCHFRGACMLYDHESRILFSGDLLGGIATSELMATGANWAGMKAFHELYMPSNEALRLAVKRIQALDPPPLMIAPQHGGILSGPMIDLFLEKIAGLMVGLDIIRSLDEKIPLLIAAINDSAKAAREMLGDDAVDRVMRFFHLDGSYPSIFALSQNGKVVDIKSEPFSAVESLARLLFRECEGAQKQALQLRMIKIFIGYNLPPLEAAIDWEGPDEAKSPASGAPGKKA